MLTMVPERAEAAKQVATFVVQDAFFTSRCQFTSSLDLQGKKMCSRGLKHKQGLRFFYLVDLIVIIRM